MSLLMESLRYKDKSAYRALLLRRTMPELRRSLIVTAHEYLNHAASWNGSDNTYTFPSGAVLEFGHCQNEDDVYKYDSAAYDYIGFDELTTFTEFQYNYISVRNRGQDETIPKRIRSASNPGKVGHGWVKRRFIDNKEPYKLYKLEGESDLTTQHIPARVYDNPTLLKNNPQYVQRLKSLNEPYRSAMLDGNWDLFIGQYFSEFAREKNGKPYHVISSFKIDPNLAIYRSFDWGFAAPCSIHWHTVIPMDGFSRVITFAEEYKTQITPKEWAEIIMEKESKMGIDPNKVIGVSDPSAHSRNTDGGLSIISQIAEASKHKVRFAEGNNDRVNGWFEMRKWLAEGPDRIPLWQITSNCVNLIRTLPELVHDDNKVEDVDADGEAHAPDECRYFFMLNPRLAKPVSPPEPTDKMEARRDKLIAELGKKRGADEG